MFSVSKLRGFLLLSAGAGLVTALVLLGGLVAGCENRGSSAGDAPLFELTEWRGLRPEYGDRFSLRRESEGAGALLMRHSRRDVVYKYDPVARTLKAVPGAEWESARGAIAECGSQFPRANLLVTQGHKLTLDGRELPAAGQTVLSVAESPGGGWAAVLSASGKAGTSVVPFSAGGGASGRYYHQLLSLPGASWVGTATAVPTRNEEMIPCWSADEQFVVYRQTGFNYLSVVATELPSTSNPSKVSK